LAGSGRPAIVLLDAMGVCPGGLSMRFVRLLLVAAAFVLAGGAPSVRADDKADCFSRGSDDFKQKDFIARGMAACGRLISSGNYSGTELAFMFRGRGYWKHKQGDFDGAIEDYSRAIALDPKHVEGYDYRADSWQAKGDLDRAIADYDMAIRHNPSYAAAYYSRGRVHETKGQTDRARADYHAALAVPAQNRIDEWAHRSAREALARLP
jgi:tetratricopeptide (TPR) repeat protein